MPGEHSLLGKIPDGSALAQAIVDTIREPLLVLDARMHVLVGSQSFYRSFRATPEDTVGRQLYTLNNGQWDIPALRQLLDAVLPKHQAVEEYEMALDVAGIGRRTLLLNARQMGSGDGPDTTILLAMEDVTPRRTTEIALADLLKQKGMMLEEMQHRIANSLQIIASILMLKARTVSSVETRQQLQEAHERVLSVAAVQQHLRVGEMGARIPVGPYLTKLCESLGRSMIRDPRRTTIRVRAEAGTAPSTDAVSIGLIVTELIINALKHAFSEETENALIEVSFEVDGDNWQLCVSDNGVGMPPISDKPPVSGLGTALVNALAKQLAAVVRISSGPGHTKISVVHAVFPARKLAA